MAGTLKPVIVRLSEDLFWRSKWLKVERGSTLQWQVTTALTDFLDRQGVPHMPLKDNQKRHRP